MEEHDRRVTPIRYAPETVISAAQNHEDVLLHRVLGQRRSGFYVDIGAGDPNWDSVTNWFYRNGWTGINIEANPMFGPIYAVHRPRDVNLSVGIGAQAGTASFFEVISNDHQNGWGLSSFDPAIVDRARSLGLECRELSVEVCRLDEILDRHAAGRQIDFLKIDVEGSEMSVIDSMGWTRHRPTIICIEAVQPNSAAPSFPLWEQRIVQQDYVFALFDGANNYYLDRAHENLLPQFNAFVNLNDHYRRAETADFSL